MKFWQNPSVKSYFIDVEEITTVFRNRFDCDFKFFYVFTTL